MVSRVQQRDELGGSLPVPGCGAMAVGVAAAPLVCDICNGTVTVPMMVARHLAQVVGIAVAPVAGQNTVEVKDSSVVESVALQSILHQPY